MQPIEVIRVTNDPGKWAKTKKQRELVEDYRSKRGMTVQIQKEKEGR